MKNLHTKKTSNGSNFGWLIQQMSINQKSGRQTFRKRFVSGSVFVSPCPPECYLQSETKIEPDLRLYWTWIGKIIVNKWNLFLVEFNTKWQKIIILGGKSDFRCCSEIVVKVLIWLWRDSVVKACWNEVVVVKSLINSRKHTCTYF